MENSTEQGWRWLATLYGVLPTFSALGISFRRRPMEPDEQNGQRNALFRNKLSFSATSAGFAEHHGTFLAA
jgi:hypothetical protein